MQQPGCKFEEEAKMTGDPLLVLNGLVQVFPQVNLSTLIEVSISFNGDADGAADYVIHNVLPNISRDENNANVNGDFLGKHEVSGDTNNDLLTAPVVNDTLSAPRQSESDVAAKEYSAENEEIPMGEQLMQSAAVASTSDLAGLPEESNSDTLLAGAQSSVIDHENQQKVMHSSDHLTGGRGDEQIQFSSETNEGIPISEDNLTLHDDDSHDTNMQSNYSVSPESIDDVISAENNKKDTLLSSVTAVSVMLEQVELSEAETKIAVSEASQAGNDILVEAAKLKEMSTVAVEENNKVAAEVFAEKSILASEAQGLHSRLFNISEERNHFVAIIDEMHETLQRRRELAEAEREAAERDMMERERIAREMLKEQELLLEAAKEESKKLVQQAHENGKLRELLTDRGHVVDALHGEMLGIFDNISQLQYRVDTHEQRQLVSSAMSRSVESAACKLPDEEPLHFPSPSLPSPVNSAPSRLFYADEPLEQSSSSLAGSVQSAPSKLVSVEPLQLASSSLSSSVKSAASESSWSSATESNASFNGDEEIALDDSWDVIEEDEQCMC